MFFQVYLIRDVSVGENTENPSPTHNTDSVWSEVGESLRRGFTLVDEKYNLVIGISVVRSKGEEKEESIADWSTSMSRIKSEELLAPALLCHKEPARASKAPY